MTHVMVNLYIPPGLSGTACEALCHLYCKQNDAGIRVEYCRESDGDECVESL